jgi:hypothetical protein
MSRSTISTFQLFAMFPDEDSARVYLEGRIWPSGPTCPACGTGERVSTLGTCATRKPGYYRCLSCAFHKSLRLFFKNLLANFVLYLTTRV